MTKLLLATLLAVTLSACGGPTAPTATPPPPVVTPPPAPPPSVATIAVVVCPDVVAGMDTAFYRQIGCNAFDTPIQPVRHWTLAPKVYLRTVDDAGSSIDVLTLDTVQNAMIEVASALTGGRFGLEGVLRGEDSREGQSGWLTVRWPATAQAFCGRSDVGVDGGLIELSYLTAGCGCNGSAMRPSAARHELGHALGYWHTDNPDDLMSNLGATKPCDRLPSARELAAMAYQYR